MIIKLKTKLNILHLVKLCFFSMLLYSSFLMEVMDVRIANMTLTLGALTAVLMVLDMLHAPYGFVTIMTYDVILLLAFVLVSALGTVFAYYPGTAWNGLIQLLQNVLLMMITIYISIRDGSVTFCARTVVIVMAAATIYALLNTDALDNRLALTESSNANVFGHNAVLGVGLSAIAFGDGKRFRRLLVPALCVLFAAGVVFSASRMSFIALLGYLVVYLVYYVPQNRQRSMLSVGVKFLAALVVAAALIMILAPYFKETLIAERMADLFNVFNTGDGDGQARVYLYKAAWEAFLNHPIFGLGYANFAPLHFGVYTHSTYAEVLSCTGIMGTMVFLAYYLCIVKGLKYGVKLADPALQKTSRLLVMLFVSLLLLGFGEILIYKIKYFIVYGILAAQFWLNRRHMARLAAEKAIEEGRP